MSANLAKELEQYEPERDGEHMVLTLNDRRKYHRLDALKYLKMAISGPAPQEGSDD